MSEPKQMSHEELAEIDSRLGHIDCDCDVHKLLAHVAWLEGENKRIERVIPCAACGVCRGEIGVITTTIADRGVRDRHTAESTRAKLVEVVKERFGRSARTVDVIAALETDELKGK